MAATGYRWHLASDGMATFPRDDGGYVLVSNSETVEGGASALRFPAEAETLSLLATFVDLERRCCAFLRFELTVEPDGGPVWLELTGPPGAREFLQAELDGVRL